MQQGERELISRLLQSGRMNRVLASGVTPDVFHSYRPEFEYLLDQWQRHSEIPSIKLFKERFPDFPYRKIVGGDPSVAPAIEAVLENHLELSLARVAEQFVNKLGEAKPADLLAEVKGTLEQLSATDAGEEQVDIVADIMSDVEQFARLQRSEEQGETAFIPAPWTPLNDYWGGLRGGELIGVIARANSGKSWLGIQMAAHAALYSQSRPFIAPLEMSRYDVACRLHSIWSYYMARDESPKHLKLPEITNRARIQEMMTGRSIWQNTHLAIGSNKIDIQDYRAWAEMVKAAMPRGLVMPNMTAQTTSFTLDTFIRHIERSECDIAVLDYLSLLDIKKKSNESQWEVWQDITRRLKREAMRLNIPIIVMGQANRNATSRRTPELEDIAFSDGFGQNADRVLSLRQTGERMAVTCIKNRIGQKQFRFWLHFVPDFGILEYDRHAGVEENLDG